MSRTALTLFLLPVGLMAASAWAQTGVGSGASPQAPGYYHPESSYEAETPILLGTFLEHSGSAAPAEPGIGVSPRPITILTDPARSEPAAPRVEPIMTIKRGK